MMKNKTYDAFYCVDGEKCRNTSNATTYNFITRQAQPRTEKSILCVAAKQNCQSSKSTGSILQCQLHRLSPRQMLPRMIRRLRYVFDFIRCFSAQSMSTYLQSMIMKPSHFLLLYSECVTHRPHSPCRRLLSTTMTNSRSSPLKVRSSSCILTDSIFLRIRVFALKCISLPFLPPDRILLPFTPFVDWTKKDTEPTDGLFSDNWDDDNVGQDFVKVCMPLHSHINV